MQEVRARDYANKSAKITARIPAKLHKSRAILKTKLGPYTLVHPVSSHGNRGGEGVGEATLVTIPLFRTTFLMKALFPVFWSGVFWVGTIMVLPARVQISGKTGTPTEWA